MIRSWVAPLQHGPQGVEDAHGVEEVLPVGLTLDPADPVGSSFQAEDLSLATRADPLRPLRDVDASLGTAEQRVPERVIHALADARRDAAQPRLEQARREFLVA